MWVQNRATPWEPPDAPMGVPLLVNGAATGGMKYVSNGTYYWQTSGVFGGATAQLQWSGDSGLTWIDVAGASATTPSSLVDVMISEGHVRVALTGTTGSTSISSNLRAAPCC